MASWKENALVRYLIDAKAELKKVAWPTRQETINATIVVVSVSVGTALFLSMVDYGLSAGLQLLVK